MKSHDFLAKIALKKRFFSFSRWKKILKQIALKYHLTVHRIRSWGILRNHSSATWYWNYSSSHQCMITVPLRVLPGMYKHIEPEYQAFVGLLTGRLYIINISVQINANLRWSATIIKSICCNLQNEHPMGPRKISDIIFRKVLPSNIWKLNFSCRRRISLGALSLG